MVNITRYINPIAAELDLKMIEDESRDYLGFSSIGKECRRSLWYGWRWATPRLLERRMVRLLDRGHKEEEIIIADLESMGMVVSNTQAELVHNLMGRHSRGHIDGEVENVPYAEKTVHLLEMKTMADQYWNACKTQGVEVAEPEYYGQAQLYMKYRKRTRALFVATNKNTDRRIYERITYDESVASELNKKVTDIICSELPPRGIARDPAFYKCKMCRHRPVCYGKKPPLLNCRTCSHAVVEDDGVWVCGVDKKQLTVQKQKVGCSSYRRLF